MYVCAFIFNSSMIISIYVSLPVYVSASACINMYLKNGQIRASFADKKDHIKRYICNSFPLRHCWKSLPQLSGRSHAAMLNLLGAIHASLSTPCVTGLTGHSGMHCTTQRCGVVQRCWKVPDTHAASSCWRLSHILAKLSPAEACC